MLKTCFTARAASLLPVAACIFLAVSCSTDYPAQNEAPGPGYAALFNGRDFTGWNMGGVDLDKHAWSVEDGLMHCKGKPRNPYLILTEKDYENFDFYAEFRVSEGCNSGIFFHVPSAGRQSYIGFEAQIMDDAWQNPTKNSTGAVYDVVPPITNMMKPAGRWNRYHVRIDWPVVKIWLNGQLVQDVDFSAHPILRYRMRTGPIGLSNHGHPVDYRNLWIRELPSTDTGGDIFNGRDLAKWEIIGDADWHVEDGEIVSTKGAGWLVTREEYDKVFFQAYVDSDTLTTRDARIHYRWKSVEDTGCPVALYDYRTAKKYTAQYGKKIPPDVIRPMTSRWFLYRIVSADRESIVYLNEHVVSENRLLGEDPRGRIAVWRGADDGIIRIREPKLRVPEGPGI